MTFKDFFYKEIKTFCENYATSEYEIQFESPLFTGSYGGNIDNPAFNKIRVESILSNDRFLENIKVKNISINVFYDKRNDGLEEYNFLDKDNKFLLCFAYIRETGDGGTENNSIWNSYETKGLYFNLFFEYFLPKTKYIQSSDNNTKEASDFWIKASKLALDKNLKVSIINLKTKDENFINDSNYLTDNFSSIWGNNLHDVRIRIYNYEK
jgi:hypothetical protein